jgi:hypothetical protein
MEEMIDQIHGVVSLKKICLLPFFIEKKYLIDCSFLQLTVIKILATCQILLNTQTSLDLPISLNIAFDNRVYFSPSNNRCDFFVTNIFIFAELESFYYGFAVSSRPEMSLEVIVVTVKCIAIFTIDSDQVFKVMLVHECSLISDSFSLVIPHEERILQGAIQHHQKGIGSKKSRVVMLLKIL